MELAPVIDFEVFGDECGFLGAVAFVHELEDEVDLLGLQDEVAKLIDKDHVEADESLKAVLGGPVGFAGRRVGRSRSCLGLG